jgi:phytoene dehydrogenase-like protein
VAELGVAEFDAIVVGSGVNGLACAALLAKGGKRVCVLERNDWFGGAIKTAEITEPGFHHDVFSAWHPLWVGGAAHAQLGDDLARHGLEYLNTELPTGTLYPDGASAFLLRTAEANAVEFDRHHQGDGDAWKALLGEFFPNADFAFGILGTELWSRHGAALAAKAYRRLGRRGAAEFTGRLLVSARDWLETAFVSGRAHGLLAPWVLHTGLGPDAAASGYMAQVIAVAVQEGGMPIPRGGGARLAGALVGLIRERGGTCETGVEVERVFGGGVRVAGGDVLSATDVICNVTPTQLYGQLLDGFGGKAERFRYGRSEMQIHFALSEPPVWEGDDRLGQTAIVHVTPGLDGVSRAVNEAERGLLPAEATVVVGQPLTMDPSRAPEGKGILWIQLQELPWHVKGDAAEAIDVGDGLWTEDLRERYADRIQARLARHIPNLESTILGRVSLSPADLQAANVNLVQGDPYGGSLALDQNFLWRPLASQPGHRTPVEHVWHVGASTHPGPGLGGGSGALVAAQLLEPPLARRVAARGLRAVRRR